jgi:glutaredoxin 2
VIFLGDFSFVRMFLKNYRVTMTTTLDTSCSENTMVLSARRGIYIDKNLTWDQQISHVNNKLAKNTGINKLRYYVDLKVLK